MPLLPLTIIPSLWHSIDKDNFYISPSFSLLLPQFLLYLSSLSSMNALHFTSLFYMPFLLTLAVSFAFSPATCSRLITKMWLWLLQQTEAFWLHSAQCSYQDHQDHFSKLRVTRCTSRDALLTPSLCFLQSPHPAEWADGENKDILCLLATFSAG